MICDAHIHVGYWCVDGVIRYYSPRRVIGVLNRCNVNHFIASSTSPQAGAIDNHDLIREAKEVVRLSGNRAHIYCWVTGAMYDSDPELTILDSGIYEGVKLHECETPWNRRRKKDLCRIVGIARRRGLNVMFHCGQSNGCSPLELAWVAQSNPDLKFNFAHCRPMDEMLQVMRMHKNVYTDISCLPTASIKTYMSIMDVSRRVMFGSDFPSVFKWSRLTSAYRRICHDIGRLVDCQRFNAAFRSFTSSFCLLLLIMT